MPGRRRLVVLGLAVGLAALPSAVRVQDAPRFPAQAAAPVDCLGLSPAVLQQLPAALARWLRERAQPLDEVTLVTTSGDVWWGDRIAHHDGTSASGAALVPASDARIAVMGRSARTAAGHLRIGYPGVTLRLRFEGTGLALRASSTTGDDHLGVSVDGGEPRVVRLARRASEIPLARGLAAGAHTVEVVHRTETWQGVTTVEGVLPAPGARLVAPEPWPSRRLLFVGDSVTCGENVDRAEGACRKDASRWDPSRSYGLLIARDLGAQAHLVCYGGRGLVRDWQGRRDVLNAPSFFDLALAEKGGPAWDHAAYAPDVIVVALGTNDFNLALGPLPAREEWVDAYVAFLRAVRSRHPRAPVLLTEGPIVDDAADPARAARTVLRAYLAEVVRRLGDARVRALSTERRPGDACDAHPTAAQHADMARELEPAVRAAAGW